MVKAGVQWGLFGGAVQALGTERHHERYLAPMMSLELPGCFAMTETGHGSDVQSLRTTATYDAATPGVRRPHAGRRGPQGLHRQRGAGRPGGGRLRPARQRAGSSTASTPWSSRSATRPVGPCPASHRGLRPQGRAQRRRQRAAVVRRRCACRARRCSTATATVAPDGTYSSPIESGSARFFTMLGALVRGRVSVGGAAGSAAKAALAIAVDVRRARAASSRRRGAATRSPCSTTSPTSAGCCPRLATTYALHFAQAELACDLHDVQTGGTDDDARQRELESRAAGLKA